MRSGHPSHLHNTMNTGHSLQIEALYLWPEIHVLVTTSCTYKAITQYLPVTKGHLSNVAKISQQIGQPIISIF